jgi:Ca-activated chloride channel family protein
VLNLAYPWLLVLLPVPWLLQRWLPDYREARPALRVPFMDRLAAASGQTPGRGSTVLAGHTGQKLLLLVVWSLLIIALARPQWLEEPIVEERSLRDMLLLVDLSGSMEISDFIDEQGQQIDRLTAVKQVLSGFLEQRQGDRIGLIFFGSAPFVQAPFSDDLETLQTLLDEAIVGMAGPKTVIGDALGLALNLFEERDIEERVVILLTDGNDTGSVIPPDQAAQIAHDEGVIVHVVGVGSTTLEGEQPLDEKTLQAIASVSGGEYFKAEDQQGLESVYKTLDQLTPKKVEGRSYRPRSELYHWPLGGVMILFLGFHLLLAMRFSFKSAA